MRNKIVRAACSDKPAKIGCEEVAKELGITRVYLYHLRKQGKIKMRKVFGRYFLYDDDLALIKKIIRGWEE